MNGRIKEAVGRAYTADQLQQQMGGSFVSGLSCGSMNTNELSRYPQVQKLQDEQEKLVQALIEAFGTHFEKLRPVVSGGAETGRMEPNRAPGPPLCRVAQRISETNAVLAQMHNELTALTAAVEV
jgi:hypothetical protein